MPTPNINQRGLLLTLVLSLTVAKADAIDPPSGLRLRQQAPTFAELKKLAKPRFDFNDTDFAWTSRDAKGNLTFTFERAYLLRLDPARTAYALVDNTTLLASELVGEGYIYPRHTEEAPKVLLRDPDRGVVYQATWISHEIPGTGHWTAARDLYFLCDAQGRWHFLAEGPGVSSGRTGPEQYYAGEVKATAEWALDKVEPVKLRFTRVREYYCPVEENNASAFPNLLIQTPLEPVQPGRDLKPAETETGEEGNRLRRSGPDYVVVERPETVGALVKRLAWWLQNAKGHDPESDSKKLAKVEALLLAANPKLPANLKAGTKVLVPKKMQE